MAKRKNNKLLMNSAFMMPGLFYTIEKNTIFMCLLVM